MSLLPEPSINYGLVSSALLPVAGLILLTGLLASAAHSAAPRDLLRSLTRTIVIVAVIAHFDFFVNQSQDYVQKLITEQLKASPDDVARESFERHEVGDVEREGDRVIADRTRRSLERRCGARDERDLSATRRPLLGDRETDARGCAGDDRDLALHAGEAIPAWTVARGTNARPIAPERR